MANTSTPLPWSCRPDHASSLGPPWRVPLPGLIIAVLSSGLVCYFLAWYMTKPVTRLRAATQQLAAGDLTARAGDPKSKRRDEIAGLVRDFDTMAARLETLVKAQSRLLNDISHELRSPLARLNVALGLARQRSGPESGDYAGAHRTRGRHHNELIGRLLLWLVSRMASNASPPLRFCSMKWCSMWLRMPSSKRRRGIATYARNSRGNLGRTRRCVAAA